MKEEYIQSPCIRECLYDYEGNYCTGCFRKLDEIFDWSKRSNEEKLDIIKRSKLRKETILEGHSTFEQED